MDNLNLIKKIIEFDYGSALTLLTHLNMLINNTNIIMNHRV